MLFEALKTIVFIKNC